MKRLNYYFYQKCNEKAELIILYFNALIYKLQLVELVIFSNLLLYFYRPGTTPRAIMLLRHF